MKTATAPASAENAAKAKGVKDAANAAKVAKRAYIEDKTLREVVLELGLLDEAAYDEAMQLDKMVRPTS